MLLMEVLRRDVLSKFTGEVVSRMAFLFFFFYAGRKLGAADFGSLSLSISLTYVLGILFLDPGLNLATIPMLVAHPERARQIVGSVFSLKILLFLPLLLVLAVMSIFWSGRLPARLPLLLAALYTLFTILLEYLGSITNAYHRMDLEAYFKILNRFLVVTLGAIALQLGRIPALLAAMTMATLMACIASWFVLRRRLIVVDFRWQFEHMLESLRQGAPIAGTLIVTAIYLKWDLLVLSYFNIGREQVGWYAGAFKLVEALSAVPGILGAALFPMMIQLRRQNSGQLERLLSISTKAMLLFSIPVAATISLLSRQIIFLVYGPKYLPGASVLAVLIWCVVPIFVYFYLVFVNIAAGYAKFNLLAGCAALIVGLVANVFLVPRIGYLGAAWAALLANSTFALLALWKVCQLFGGARLLPATFRFAAAGALMGATFAYSGGNVWVELALGLLVYAASLAILGVLSRGDISLVLRLFSAGGGQRSIETVLPQEIA
jgi:O-antigen/teichoic acid export membrane protein